MLNWSKVWRKRRPWHNLNTNVVEVILRDPRSIRSRIVLLKNIQIHLQTLVLRRVSGCHPDSVEPLSWRYKKVVETCSGRIPWPMSSDYLLQICQLSLRNRTHSAPHDASEFMFDHRIGTDATGIRRKKGLLANVDDSNDLLPTATFAYDGDELAPDLCLSSNEPTFLESPSHSLSTNSLPMTASALSGSRCCRFEPVTQMRKSYPAILISSCHSLTSGPGGVSDRISDCKSLA